MSSSERVGKFAALALLLLYALPASAQQHQKSKSLSSPERMGLIELEASTTLLNDSIREGSYDDSFRIRRARYYVPDLSDCSEKIADAVKCWAKEKGAAVVKSEPGNCRVLVHVKKRNLPGYYELLYRVDPAKGTGRVTFVHIRAGVPTNPDTDSQSGVEDLVPLLKEALTCVQPSSSR